MRPRPGWRSGPRWTINSQSVLARSHPPCHERRHAPPSRGPRARCCARALRSRRRRSPRPRVRSPRRPRPCARRSTRRRTPSRKIAPTSSVASCSPRSNAARTWCARSAMSSVCPDSPGGFAPPESLLALDDLRREIQRLDAEIASGARRTELLEQERTSTSAQLTEKVAAERTLLDAGADPDAIAMAKLETALTESATAEVDMMLRLLGVQQTFAQAQRDAIASALTTAGQRPADGVRARRRGRRCAPARTRRRTAPAHGGGHARARTGARRTRAEGRDRQRAATGNAQGTHRQRRHRHRADARSAHQPCDRTACLADGGADLSRP